jgi:membrane protein
MLLFAVLAIIYHFGPNYKQKFVAVTPGAVFSVAVWLMLGVGFRLYLSKLGGAATYNRTYGALAGAAILLLFFYIDALVLLIGAEINSEIDFALTGKHGVPAEPVADAVPPPVDSVKPS